MKQSHKRIKNLSILLFLFTLLAAVLPRAQAQDVYWTIEGAKIMGSDVAGDNVVEVFDGTGMAGTPVDVVATDTHIYWTDKNDTAAGGVWRANRDGSEAALFVTNPGSTNWAPQFIAIDEASDALYFSCYYTGLYSASLSTGGPAVSLGRPDNQPISPDNTPTTTGIALRNSNELLSVAAGQPGTLYTTNISAKTHTVFINWMNGSGFHGLAYNPATDTAYITDIGGTLYSFHLGSWAQTALLTGLHEPLGVALSESGSHLLYVERGAMRRISAYDLAQPENSFELVTGQDAFFGVGIAGDPQAEPVLPPPDPLAPGTELVHEDFSNGTIGSDLTGTSETGSDTSDGKGRWINGAGRSAVYGGTDANKTFLSTGNGLAYAFLSTDTDAAESYSVVLNNVSISTTNMDGGSSFLFGARRSGVELGWAYNFRPVGATGAPANEKFWEISYIRDEGSPQKVIVGYLFDQVLQLATLELRVHGDRVTLYIDGERFDHSTRPTQGTALDNTVDNVIHISLNSVPADTLTLEFDELRATVIEPRAESPKRRLFAYEGFDYPAGDVVGQDGGIGWAEPWMPSVEGNAVRASAQVDAVGDVFGELSVVGGKVRAFDQHRGFRYIDTDRISSEQLTEAGNIGKPGTSVWVSLMMESIGDGSESTFWGLAFFRDSAESLLIGKAGGTGANHTSLRVQSQTANFQQFPELTYQEKHFIVLRKDFLEGGGARVTVFHNPDPRLPTPTDDTAIGVYERTDWDFSFNRVRLAAAAGSPGFWTDELRIGATWADVTPVPYTMPYNGFVNGDLEAEPFLEGWSYFQHITPHAGIAPGSATAAYVKNDTTPGSQNWPLMGQHRPNWLEYDTIPLNDPVTGEPMADQLQPTGPEWQVGFYTAVASTGGGDGTRSLNLGINFERPERYTRDLAPAINFRITGDGAGKAYHGGSTEYQTVGWVEVFPNGTFQTSTHADGVFTDPIVYYIEFNGDFREDPHYVVSVEEVGGVFSAVSEPVRAYQYIFPDPFSGIMTVRFNGVVQAPYVVDDIHMITTGEPPTDGYAAWQQQHFGSETDPAIVGEDADSDGDGIPNLLEYAFGSNPVVADRSALPTQSVQEIGGEQYLTITITRPTGLSDVDYGVFESSDLEIWSDTAVQVGNPIDNGDGTETIIYRSSQPVSSSSRWFLEVRVARIEMA